MRYSEIGNTGIKISSIAMGGHEYLPDGRSRGFNEDMTLATTPGYIFPGFGGEPRKAVLRMALEYGVNFFDVTQDSEKEALGRKVILPGGASLVIDEREALHTIDVNSGGNVVAEDGRSLACMQNLAAIPEIARQIRLRNLSGIILVDFIDMDDPAERAEVASALEEALSADRTKTVLHGFTSLGLMELTRKRTGQSLREMLTVPCSHCAGTGMLADI